jgi:hypothetical protein
MIIMIIHKRHVKANCHIIEFIFSLKLYIVNVCKYCLRRSLRTVWLLDVTFSAQHTASIFAVPSYSECHSTIRQHHEALRPSNVNVPYSGSSARRPTITFIHCAAIIHISVTPKTVLTFSVVVWVVHFVYSRVIPSAEGGLFPFPPSCLSWFVRIFVYFQISYKLKILVFGMWKNLWLWVSRCRVFERTYSLQRLASLDRWRLRPCFSLEWRKVPA